MRVFLELLQIEDIDSSDEDTDDENRPGGNVPLSELKMIVDEEMEGFIIQDDENDPDQALTEHEKEVMKQITIDHIRQLRCVILIINYN